MSNLVFLKIERKKADLAIWGFSYNVGRIKVAHFMPAWSYQPIYWWTRYPLETTKMWNLIYLFTPASWMWTFLSIASIVISLKIFTIIGTRLGLNLLSEEITLFPFRYVKQSRCWNIFNYIFRIRILETPVLDRGSILPRGFSQNLCLLAWTVFGGILM